MPNSWPALLAWIGDHGWPEFLRVALIMLIAIAGVLVLSAFGGHLITVLIRILR